MTDLTSITLILVYVLSIIFTIKMIVTIVRDYLVKKKRNSQYTIFYADTDSYMTFDFECSEFKKRELIIMLTENDDFTQKEITWLPMDQHLDSGGKLTFQKEKQRGKRIIFTIKKNYVNKKR